MPPLPDLPPVLSLPLAAVFEDLAVMPDAGSTGA